MPTVDLTPRLVRDSGPGAGDTILFDRALPGFGLRIHPSGRKVWIVQARIGGRSRRMVIARHSDMDLAEARRRARDMLARIRAGGNPADKRRRVRRTPLFRAFAEEYLRRSEPQWKPSGRKTVRIYLNARILPAFGAMPLDRIGPEDVAAWFDAASRDRPGAANRAFEILRAMMFRAEEWGWRERGSNPCLGIRKNARNKVARFLDADELERLGRGFFPHRPEGHVRRHGMVGIHQHGGSAVPAGLHREAWLARDGRVRSGPVRSDNRQLWPACGTRRQGYRLIARLSRCGFDSSVDDTWEIGIKLDIEDSGYKPIRIDKAEFNDRIDDEIIAEVWRGLYAGRGSCARRRLL